MKIIRFPMFANLAFWRKTEGLLFMSGELRANVIYGPSHWKLLREERGIWVYYKDRLKFLWNKLLRGSGTNFGVVSRRVVTTAGVNNMRDDFASSGSADISLFHFHDSGTGTNVEDVGDVDLQIPAGPTTRATGTQDNSVSKVFTTVGTITYTGTLAITEWGMFQQAARGAGSVLWDRSKFTAINVVNGDSIQGTYSLTINDGG